MLELDFWTVVLQVINFTVLALVLYWLLFKPMKRIIQARQEEKERLIRELEQERQMLSVQRATLDERLSRLDEEAANILMLAREQAEAERAELLRQARAEVEQIMAEAHTDAYRMRKQALESFNNDLVEALIEISGNILGKLVSPQMHDSLVRQLSNSIWELGRTDIQRVEVFRQALGSREPTAHITSARPLTQEHQGLLARTLTALADRHVNLDVRVDPKMIAGVRVRVGDLMVDSSVWGQLEALREQAMHDLEERFAHD